LIFSLRIDSGRATKKAKEENITEKKVTEMAGTIRNCTNSLRTYLRKSTLM
jgi:hypothetical protein